MSRKGPFIVFRVIGFLLVVALFIGGGAMAFRAGVSQGISQAPAVATAIAKAAESGQVAPVPQMYGHEFGYGYGYGPGYPMMYGRHHFGFFPFGAICGSIFFLFLFFGFMKMMFFRRMMWGGRHGHHGPPWMRHHDHDCEENKDGEKKDSESKAEGKDESKKE